MAVHYRQHGERFRAVYEEQPEKYEGWLRLLIWFCCIFVLGGLTWGYLLDAVI